MNKSERRRKEKDDEHFKKTGRHFYWAGELIPDPSEPEESGESWIHKISKDFPHGWHSDYYTIKNYIDLDEEQYFQAARQAMREDGNRRYNDWTDEMRVLANERIRRVNALVFELSPAEALRIKEFKLRNLNGNDRLSFRSSQKDYGT